MGFLHGLKIKHITVIQLLSYKYYRESGVWLLKWLLQSYSWSIFNIYISWGEYIYITKIPMELKQQQLRKWSTS